MSLRIPFGDIKDPDKIHSELTITVADKINSFSKEEIYAYWMEGDSEDRDPTPEDLVSIPFSYGMNEYSLYRPYREDFDKETMVFEGSLRDHQLSVKKEAVNSLSKTGSVMISCYTGFGKCLLKGTKVRMFDGTTKNVEDLRANMLLLGDDYTARRISVCNTGKSEMFKVSPSIGKGFVCNSHHILCLKILNHGKISKISFGVSLYRLTYLDRYSGHFRTKYFRRLYRAQRYFERKVDNDNIFEVSIYRYQKLPQKTKNHLRYYRKPLRYSFIKDSYSSSDRCDRDFNPHFFGCFIGLSLLQNSYSAHDSAMLSLKEKLIYSKGYDNRDFQNLEKYLSKLRERHKYRFFSQDIFTSPLETRRRILEGVIEIAGGFVKNHFTIPLDHQRSIVKDICKLSKSVGNDAYIVDKFHSCYIEKQGLNPSNHPVHHYDRETIELNQNHQLCDFKVKKYMNGQHQLYFGIKIDGNHRFFLEDGTVTHNTVTGIKLLSEIRLPTMVITKGLTLINQWVDSFARFSPSTKVQIMTTKTKPKPDTQVFVVNNCNVTKLSMNILDRIGVVLVDEAHQVMSKKGFECLTRLSPRYLIGLTATPYRPDDLDVLMGMYFGKKIIYRPLNREHILYKIRTPYKAVIEEGASGRLDWNKVLESTTIDTRKNDDIVTLIEYFPERVFLVLTKRVEQGLILMRKLKEKKIFATSLFGAKKTFDRNARVVVASIQKAGTGFDHDRLDSIILASDFEGHFTRKEKGKKKTGSSSSKNSIREGDVQGYFIQYIGRCMRKENHLPMIFDFVDSGCPSLYHHSRRRDEVSIQHGGRAVDFFEHHGDIFGYRR